MRARAALGGIALAFTPGFNAANVGAVADRTAHAYDVGLAVVGLFTTALFLTHALCQVPMGRLCDRYGARIVGALGLGIVAVASAAALSWREPAFGISMRLVAGVGTAAAFVAGSDYVRSTIGTPVAQGAYGAVSMAGGGLALALVPLWATWRAPFAAAALIAAAGVALVALAPRAAPGPRHDTRRVFNDRRLRPLAAWHSASFGLSVIVGNWVVTLLERAGSVSEHVAGLAGGLVLLLGVITRPLGGRYIDRPRVVQASFVVGGAAVALLAIVSTLPAGIVACAVIGAVNMAAAATILFGTPLLGLAFSLPGDGRIGFVAVAVLWASASLTRPRPRPR